MGKLFRLDSPLMQGLTRLADVMIVNLLFLCSCVPLITIGPANAAMYDVIGRLQREEGTVWACYWKAFRANFRQAAGLWGVLLLCGTVIVGCGLFYLFVSFPGRTLVILLALLLFVLWCVTAVWVFPLQSRFENTVNNTLKNAVLCGVAWLPRSLLAAALQLVPAALLLFLPELFLRIGVLWLTLWFSGAAWLTMLLLRKPFRRLEDLSAVGTTAAEEKNRK